MEVPNIVSINNDKNENDKDDNIDNDNSIYDLVFDIISNINKSEKGEEVKQR